MGKGTRAWQFLWVTVLCVALVSFGNTLQSAAWGDWSQVATKLFFMPFAALVFGGGAFLLGLFFKHPSASDDEQILGAQSDVNARHSATEIADGVAKEIQKAPPTALILGGIFLGFVAGAVIVMFMHPSLDKQNLSELTDYSTNQQNSYAYWYIVYGGNVVNGTPFNSMQDCEKSRIVWRKNEYNAVDMIANSMGSVRINNPYTMSLLEGLQHRQKVADAAYCQVH